MSAQPILTDEKQIAGDMYSGAGGLTIGMKEAFAELGIKNVQYVAINHWDVAIDSYKANNPLALTYCTSVDQVNPREVVPGRFMRLLCAAPECTGHSNARGGQPTNEQLRAGAMHVLHWCAELCIEGLVMENVPEFMKWGPLGPNGRPIKREQGKYFQAFVNGLRAMDYTVVYRVVCCADHGDATTRKRFMLLAKRNVNGGTPPEIHYPEPTHSDPVKLQAMKATGLFAQEAAKLEPWLTARNDVIDWTIKSKSIFFRKRPLALKTLQRIRAGLVKFGGEGAAPFIELLDRYSQLVYAETKDYKSPLAKSAHERLMSEGVCTLRAELSPDVELRSFVSVFRRNSDGRSVDEPLPSLCADGQHMALASAMLVNLKGESTAASLDAPLPTQTGTAHLYVAEPFTIAIDQHGGNGDTTSSIDGPLPTLVTKANRAVVQPEAFIVAHPMYQHAKDGELALVDSLDRPLRTIVGENGRGFKLCEPTFMVPNFGERDGQNTRTQDVDEPLATVTSHGAGALVEARAFLTDLAHGDGSEDPVKAAARRVNSVDEPIITVTGRSGPYLAEPQAFVVTLANGAKEGEGVNAADCRVKSVDEPLPTQTAGGNRFGLCEPSAFLTQYNGTGESQSVDEPLRTQTAKDRFALVETKIGPLYYDSSLGVFLDIHLRMLDPDKELKRAHSFPKDYILRGKREDQVKQVGNSVPTRTAKAMCLAVLTA